ncbi:MAG TPA: lysophospholipid acyltransferase family protein [Candidatus Limnocylindrales bacterium]|nr:lysophospholipid acyltransferase family protein [Candidatus Limnocylindrales bacterium]
MLAIRVFLWLAVRSVLRVRLEGRDRLLPGPAMYCFNHLSWLDPMVMMAAFPLRSRLYFYGPREEDMQVGGRNRLMWWSGISVPFKPAKEDLITSVRRSKAIFDSGAMLAIAGEGRIHVHEGDLMPLQEGAAYLALRARVPIVPVAITGTSWVGFRRTVTIRVGEAIPTGPRPSRAVVERYSALTWHALRTMVGNDRDLPVPGRFGRWLSDKFNDWGSGGRAAASAEWGPRPGEVPIPAEELGDRDPAGEPAQDPVG